MMRESLGGCLGFKRFFSAVLCQSMKFLQLAVVIQRVSVGGPDVHIHSVSQHENESGATQRSKVSSLTNKSFVVWISVQQLTSIT